jgi:YHS domain-containing protein
MMKRTGIGLAVVALLAAVTVYAADEVNLEGIKCLVNPKAPAKAANAVEYKGAHVYFCCQNCPKAFKADTAKFAAKANHQLVATGQAKQEACPFSGQPVDADTAIKVNGASVAFCCAMCKGKAEKSEDQVELIFNDKAFEKGFKVVTAEKKE